MENENSNDDSSQRYVLGSHVGFLLRLANQRHAAIFQRLAPFGLTPTQFGALMKLAERGPCSQNELGRRTAVDVATIKGVVDRLKKKGLVNQKPDLNDKRRSMLSISERAEELVPELGKIGHQISGETLSPLTEEERIAFLSLLKKLG
ncbi:MAG: MarR family transcriptional regulator [Rhodobacterales bacterium]|nr:MAG: MarR family transcriptional regulator [Rhodobacterales bacterium]